jgi:HD superfamily phosphohydrolase
MLGYWTTFMHTPAVQRLGGVSQLGVLRFMCPSLMITRLEHSVEVARLAERVSVHLELPAATSRQLQLAALMHDTGHRALSHMYDEITETSHEARSLVEIVNLHLPSADEEAVFDFVSGAHPLQLLVAGKSGVDIDRIQYILQDSMALGIPPPFTDNEAIAALSLASDGTLVVCPTFANRLLRARAILRRTVYRSEIVQRAELRLRPIMVRLIQKYGDDVQEVTILAEVNKARLCLFDLPFGTAHCE